MQEEITRDQLLNELRRYLIHLKEIGIAAVPSSVPLDVSRPASSPIPQPQTSPQPMPASHSSQSSGGKKAASIPPQSVESAKPGQAGLDAIVADMGDCTRCKLSAKRKTIVFGSGNPEADLMFIGEGPGADEDEQGLPFVGRAGQKLTEIIEKGMKLSRADDTYICNIVKCRPPGNRDPEKDEIEACQPFLLQQIQAVRPKVIVALGKPASSTLLKRSVAITKERGTWHEFAGIPLMLTFHPAYLLRAYTLENRKAVMDDMTQVLEKLKS